MLCSESAFYLLASDSVVPYLQKDIRILLLYGNPYLAGMAMAQRIGDSLLDNPVNGIFLVLVKFQVLYLAVKIHPCAGHSVHVRYHLADGIFQAEALQGVRAQLAD